MSSVGSRPIRKLGIRATIDCVCDAAKVGVGMVVHLDAVIGAVDHRRGELADEDLLGGATAHGEAEHQDKEGARAHILTV